MAISGKNGHQKGHIPIRPLWSYRTENLDFTGHSRPVRSFTFLVMLIRNQQVSGSSPLVGSRKSPSNLAFGGFRVLSVGGRGAVLRGIQSREEFRNGVDCPRLPGSTWL